MSGQDERPDGRSDGEHSEHPEVGSVGEEAGKLFGALADWARDQGPGWGEGVETLATQAAQAARDVDSHVATGAAECTYCPICRTVHAMRRTSPEVRAHLSSAASSLLQAAAGVLATAVPAEQPRRPGVERIDLDPVEPGTESEGGL